MHARDAIRQLRFQLERYTDLHSANCVEADAASDLLEDAKAAIAASYEAENHVSPASIDFELVSTTVQGADNLYEMRIPLQRSPGNSLIVQVATPAAEFAFERCATVRVRVAGPDVPSSPATLIRDSTQEYNLLAVLLNGHARREKVDYFRSLVKKVIG